MKTFKSEDGLEVWRCLNGYIGFGVGHDSTELSPKEAMKLITYLAKLLQKDVSE